VSEPAMKVSFFNSAILTDLREASECSSGRQT